MKSLSQSLMLAMLATLLCIPFSLYATHFMGSALTYSCQSPCTYRIYHTTYYDCQGAATILPPGLPPTSAVNISGPIPGCAAPAPVGAWMLAYYVEVTPVCPGTVTACSNSNAPINGILEALQYRDYDFCQPGACGQYDVTWGSCCRQPNILSGTANDGIFLKTTIDLSISGCNSAPQFIDPAPTYICVGSATHISQCAFDPDGDSLVYSLGPCMDNALTNVGYGPGFSPTAPLGPSWTVSIDPVTGLLSFVPTPGALMIASLCVKVEEYRNGIKLGEVWRDILVVTLSCTGMSSNAPQIDSLYNVTGGSQLGAWEVSTCIGSSVSFSIAASDSNASDTLSLTAILGQLPGSASLSFTGTNPLTGNFTWAPTQPGSYAFSVGVLDGQCPLPQMAYQKVVVHVDSLCISGVVTHTQCSQSNGAIDITVTGAQAPISYLWSNGATTEDLVGISTGTYTVTATDANGVSFSNTFRVDASNIILQTNTTQPSCASPGGGAIGVSASGGTAPYTYSWTTGATTDSISGLSPGGYTVYVQDASGCPKHEVHILQQPDSCFNIIEGVVFEDQNGNCVQDAGEAGLANYLVDINPGGSVFTDANGAYKFHADTGMSVVSIYPRRFYTVNCPATAQHTFQFAGLKQVSSGNDFALDFIPVQDLKAARLGVRAKVGFTQTQYVGALNVGSIPMSGTLKWSYDSIFSIVSMNVTPLTHDTIAREITWGFTNLAPGISFYVAVNTKVDSTVGLGVWFNVSSEVLPVLGDSTPLDNSYSFQDTTRAAYDPNDKAVEPKGIRAPGYVKANDEFMDYRVRFQNTGTDTAYFVVIRDTLDDDLDYRTIQPTGASHDYTLAVEDDNVLVFTFANIYLPDSGANYAASQGFVSFRIKQKPGLSAGTELRNSAAIYFDFNAPVITNEVLNTIYTQPALSAGADTTFCGDGDLTASITAAGMPPYDFSWSHGPIDQNNTTGSTSANVSSSGTYRVSVIDAFGFIAKDSAQVTTLPLPDASFQPTIVNLTVAFANTALGNTTWAWDFGDGNSASGQGGVAHSYTLPGLYTVRLIVGNDCGADTVTQVIDLRVNSLADDAFTRSVHFAPNPMSQTAHLTFDNLDKKEFRLKVYDLQGRVVRERKSTRGDVFEVNRADLVAGVYVYELRSDAQQYVGRMMVQD